MFAKVGGLPPLFADLISWDCCSLNDLRTIYSLEDAHDIWEAKFVPMYNRYCENRRRAEMEKVKALIRR